MKKRFIMTSADPDQREALLYRIQRLTELPLLILAFIMIPLLIGPLVWDLSESQLALFTVLDTLIWAIFTVDQLIKITVSPNRVAYLRRHWLEILVVVVPFLRPLRLIRIFLFGSRAWVGVRRLVHVDFIFVYGIGLVIIAATVVATFEGGENASIQSFGDAIWWAVATITTVGYGDAVPVTAVGRAIGFVLMIGGIAFFSGITANLASFMVKGSDADKNVTALLVEEVKALRREVVRLGGNEEHVKG